MQTGFETEERIYTEEEYLAMEEQSQEKHEFYNGKMIAMPGGTATHNLIATNIATGLTIALEKSLQENFLVFNSDMKIHIARIASFVYPDAVVVCEKIELYRDRKDVIINPLLIVEVASPSTAAYDRGNKFRYYKSLPSFKEYVIIEQETPYVLASFKTAENTWTDTEATDLNQSIHLQSINCSIDLKRIYKHVQFDMEIQ
jgi:Uma2 family endonuclease